ncbi:MAG: hypothetical protein Q4C61_17225, partial [Lachnospiraceae bacterium]|nr:hypothetical protein [Lachnospiraceae bacterium]
MKLKTAVISVVVSAALVAGAGYGAYYALQGNKSPVEVVPVSNVNTGYWGGMSESIFGSVTSQVAQTVQLNEEYSIDKVYVKAGDEVREGDPLFSYDMTLQELELEMGRISLQTQELTMTKLEKDLEKLKKTTATASLEGHDRTMTAVSQEDTVIDEPSGDFSQNNTGNTEQADDIPGNAGTDNTAGTAGSGTPGGSGDSGASGAGENVGGEAGLGGIQIEDVQEMTASSDHTDQELTIVDSVVRYEQLVLVIDSLFRSYGDELRTDEIGSAVEDAVTYYRKNLAEEKVSSVVNEDGSSAEVREYVVKDEVRAALGEEEAAKLEVFSQKLEEYQLVYVEMLIQETVRETAADSSELSGALEKIQDSYDLLSEKQQQRVENVDAWRVLKEKVQEMPQNEERPEAGEDETSQETQQGESQPEAGAGETSQEIQQGESQP